MRRILACLSMCLLLAGCAAAATPAAAKTAVVSVYFANWNLYADADAQVNNLPWDSIDVINHAFWEIAKVDGAFVVRSTDENADRKHFAQYEACAEKYPGTRVMLSVGGWTRCGYFSEMASDARSRAQFIESCVRTLREHAFLGGIDIDWEYPGVARAGAGSDQGNPVRGDDFTNYTLLIQELRAALDAAFGAGEKWLTACASGSVPTLKKQDYAALHACLDRVNVMTYDMTGSYDDTTGFHTSLYGARGADNAVSYLLSVGVPAGKIAIGSPLYAHGWKNVDLSGDIVGARASGANAGGDMRYKAAAALPRADEGERGWHEGYDEQAEAAYLWNDDPASKYYGNFLTYENARSLDAKLRYIREQSLGGLIVWESAGDASGFPMLRRMAEGLK